MFAIEKIGQVSFRVHESRQLWLTHATENTGDFSNFGGFLSFERKTIIVCVVIVLSRVLAQILAIRDLSNNHSQTATWMEKNRK